MTEVFAHPTHRRGALEVVERLRRGETVPASELDFRGASLPGVDLGGLDLSGADFTDADLSRADLSRARLFKAKMEHASLVEANLEGAEMTAVDLSRANLEEAKASRAGLGMAKLNEARLFSTDLSGATLTKATITAADMRCAKLVGARIREADLDGSDFTGADLHSADLSLSNAHHAVFNNADLREARLRQLNGFETAKWIGVDIRDINFAGAYRLRRFVVDENYLKEFRSVGRLNSAVYHVWKITSDCGRSLTRWCFWITVLTVLFAWVYTFVDIDYGATYDWMAPLYYSVVTLSTLGYGDIVPRSDPGRAVAMVQVMLGYVMLGGLLSIFTNKMARRGE